MSFTTWIGGDLLRALVLWFTLASPTMKPRAKELLTPPDGEQQEVDDEQPPLVQHQVPAEHQLEAAWTSTLPSRVQYSYTSDYMQPEDFGSKLFVVDPPKELKWMVVSHVCLCLQTST